jgi:hypothetical protein
MRRCGFQGNAAQAFEIMGDIDSDEEFLQICSAGKRKKKKARCPFYEFPFRPKQFSGDFSTSNHGQQFIQKQKKKLLLLF